MGEGDRMFAEQEAVMVAVWGASKDAPYPLAERLNRLSNWMQMDAVSTYAEQTIALQFAVDIARELGEKLGAVDGLLADDEDYWKCPHCGCFQPVGRETEWLYDICTGEPIACEGCWREKYWKCEACSKRNPEEGAWFLKGEDCSCWVETPE